MIYAFNNVNDIVTAFNSSGITKTIHYQDAVNIVFSIPQYSNKVIKMSNITTSTFLTSIGDSWSSGTTIVNSYGASSSQTSWASGNNLIITPDVFLIHYAGNGTSQGSLFCKFTNGDFAFLPYHTSAGSLSYSNNGRNTTGTAKDIFIMRNASVPFRSPDGYYFESDCFAKDTGNSVDVANPLVGVKLLSKLSSGNGFNIYGNDVAIPYQYNGTTPYLQEILIKNGVI